MKRLTHILFALCLGLTSCEIEMSNNGYLDGNWQLREIDTIITGGMCDMSYSYIYWAIENDLLQVRDIDNNNLRLFFRFAHQGDSLTIHSPHLAVTKDKQIPLDNDSLLLPFGIIGLQDKFFIEQQNSSRLTLKNERFRFHFRKY